MEMDAHRWSLAVVGVVALLTLIGLVALWPPATVTLPGGPQRAPEPLVPGTVTSVEVTEVPPNADNRLPRRIASLAVLVEDGDAAGTTQYMDVDLAIFPDFEVGDPVALEVVRTAGATPQFLVVDLRRGSALLWLTLLFVALVVVVGRLRGLRALLGLGLSLFLIVRFIIPGILEGRPPGLVAMVGASAIMILTLYLSHGFRPMTTSAIVGTTGALAVTIALGSLFIEGARLTGFTSEEAVFARVGVGELDLQGLVLAGLIIASLGVLDDVTIAQSSTVFALRRTDPTLTLVPLFRRAMDVGRDHIASVVNTLVLAYAGASLAALVLFTIGNIGMLERINSEVMAEEIVKTLVGSAGLILAVPLTTLLAAAVAVRTPVEDLDDDVHLGHAH
ncbi:YibE/F family protein [Nitriliruptoraceae bacterium ZYF776]|nr:YibE/F family protein [Profundirhabdus halotolerans]